MKILVVYFSHCGNTARLADEIAWHCGAVKERIQVLRSRSAAVEACRSLWRRLTGKHAPIAPPVQDPASYDLVVIGTPVHRGAPASAVRSYIAAHSGEFKSVAFFCTNGKAGCDRAIAEMRKLCGQKPVAELVFDRTYASMPAVGEHMRQFASCLTACA